MGQGLTSYEACRTVGRNGAIWRGNQWTYRPHAAQACADARRPRPKHGKISQDPQVRDLIQRHLDLRRSPEQMCHTLRAPFPNRPETHVVHDALMTTVRTLPAHLKRP